MKRSLVPAVFLILLATSCYYIEKNKPQPYSRMPGVIFPADTVGNMEFRVRLVSDKIPPVDSNIPAPQIKGTIDVTDFLDCAESLHADSFLIVKIDSFCIIFEGLAKRECAAELIHLIPHKYSPNSILKNMTSIIIPSFDCPPDKGNLTLQYNVSILSSDKSTILETKYIRHKLYRNPDENFYRWTIDEWSYPNPFSPAPTTVLTYDVSTNGPVTIIIYNSMGNAVDTLANEIQKPGHYKINWNPDTAIPSGIYFVKLKIGQCLMTRKMLYLK